MFWYFISPHNHYHGCFLGDSGDVVGLATVPQQHPPSQMLLQAYTNNAMGPPQVGFSFRVETPTTFYIFWCLFWCMLPAFRCQARCHIHLLGLTHRGLHHCSLLELTHGRHMCNLVMVIGPHQEWTDWLLPPLLWVGVPSATQSAVHQPFWLYCGHTVLGA